MSFTVDADTDCASTKRLCPLVEGVGELDLLTLVEGGLELAIAVAVLGGWSLSSPGG
jgi:hypothetical protein